MVAKCRLCKSLLDDDENPRFTLLDSDLVLPTLEFYRFKHKYVCENCFKKTILPHREMVSDLDFVFFWLICQNFLFFELKNVRLFL